MEISVVFCVNQCSNQVIGYYVNWMYIYIWLSGYILMFGMWFIDEQVQFVISNDSFNFFLNEV